MNLRDALAAALDSALPRMAFVKYGQYMTDDPLWDIEAYYQRVSEEVLSDPAFREALTEAVAEAEHELASREAVGVVITPRVSSQDGTTSVGSDIRPCGAADHMPHARAIVDRMLEKA